LPPFLVCSTIVDTLLRYLHRIIVLVRRHVNLKKALQGNPWRTQIYLIDNQSAKEKIYKRIFYFEVTLKLLRS